MEKIDHFEVYQAEGQSDLNDKHSLGLITRKPQKKSSFNSKKNQEFISSLAIKGHYSNRYQKESPQISSELLTHQKNLQILRVNMEQKIKYLSPKNQRIPIVNSPKANVHSQKSPKFIRKNTKKGYETQATPHQGQEAVDQYPYSPIISSICLQSITDNNQLVENMICSRYQYQSIEKQNEQLKKQNHCLLEQLQFIKDELQNIIFKLEKYQQNPIQQVVTRCRNCQKIQQRQKTTVREKNEMQMKIKQVERELKDYKLKVFDLESTVQKYDEILNQLRKQLERSIDKCQKSEKMHVQLARIIAELKAKIESDTMQMRYLGIQQTVLLRKKHQCEQTRTETVKLSREKESLKKMVGEYREKIDILTKVFAKKAKTQKQIYTEDLFNLSSEQSIDGF